MIYQGIKIEGNTHIADPEFSTRIKSAIDLLNTKAGAELMTLKSYTKIIRAARVSGANFNAADLTIEIGRQTFDASLEWLASVLIHENNHLKKYKDTGKKYGDAHSMTDKRAALQVMVAEELESNRIQLTALRKVGGTEHEITYLNNQRGDHFDIDRDGDYDADDYGARTW